MYDANLACGLMLRMGGAESSSMMLLVPPLPHYSLDHLIRLQ
jgi:hypothetical protein